MSYLYQQNKFYNPNTIKDLEKFKKDVIKYNDNILLEEKYKKSSRREPTDKSLEWILEKIHSFDDVRIVDIMPRPFDDRYYLQVVFIHDWYFAWIDIKDDKKNKLLTDYNLELYDVYK